MFKHQQDQHHGAQADFKASVKYRFKDCLSRQIAEGVAIRRCDKIVLNSKAEWHQPAIWRVRSELSREWERRRKKKWLWHSSVSDCGEVNLGVSIECGKQVMCEIISFNCSQSLCVSKFIFNFHFLLCSTNMHQFYANIVSSEQAKQAKHCISKSSQYNESSLSFSFHKCFSGVTEPITFKYVWC